MYKAILLALIINSTNTYACLSVPDDITLEGSSFSTLLKTSINKNCGFSLSMTSKEKEDKAVELGKLKEEAIKKWHQENPRTAPYFSNADEEWRKKQENFLDSIREKYHQDIERKISINSKDGKLCISSANRNKPNELVCETKPIELSEKGKIVGIVTTNKNDIFIFSTDKNGKKDLNLPYIKLSPSKEQSAEIVAIDRGETIGSMTIDGEHCSRSIGSGAKSGTLSLNGKRYVSDGGGCHGSFSVVDYRQKARFMINGKTVK
ncbi:MAG: hypothetical protein KDD58_05415 [Bdellovibrionales bacterium]|nr:hypothetical protein [Bdellovibrionales bacterium]